MYYFDLVLLFASCMIVWMLVWCFMNYVQLVHTTTKNLNQSQITSHCIDRVGLGLYLLKRGLEREEEQLLGPRVAAVADGIGRWSATTMALLETGNTWPGDDDVRAREEEKVWASASGENEGERELPWAWLKR